jgi:excisionase family DNA binding protein
VGAQLELGTEARGRRFERAAAGREELLVASEVAEMLRVTTAWVYAETRAGRLPHIRVGRYYRYWPSSIERWLRDQEHR